MFHSQIITEIINQVGTKEKTDQIFAFSKKHFDLHQFNVGSLYPKDVKKMNDSLKRRYKHQEIQILSTNWNQGQRRLFVWFIICFLYEKKVDIEQITEDDLTSLSSVFYYKDTIFLDFQLRNLPKVTKSKRNWSSEEDELLKSAIKSLREENEQSKLFNNWNDVAKIMFFQTERRIFRTPKSCRQRWYNHLDQSKKKDQFTVEQDLILINYILSDSKSWSKIVKVLNYSRTEHRIKNRYYTLIRKYQRSLGSNQTEELTEQGETQIVIKLKAMLQAMIENNGQPFQMLEEKEKPLAGLVKMEEICQKDGSSSGEPLEKMLQCQNSNQISKCLKSKSETHQAQRYPNLKIEILQEEEVEPKSLSLSAQHKENSNGTIPSVEDSFMPQYESVNSYWPQNYMSYAQYVYQMGIYGQQLYEQQQNIQAPIVVNQFYCPIIVQNGMDYQTYYQQ